jgi:TATA-box binding protein (TBP) (component of TFIID and TFIIIB)
MDRCIEDPHLLCPDVDILDIPMKEIETKRINQIIDAYHENVKKKKMTIHVKTEASKITLEIHNIVMVMELRQASLPEKLVWNRASEVTTPSRNTPATERTAPSEQGNIREILEHIGPYVHNCNKEVSDAFSMSGLIHNSMTKVDMEDICGQSIGDIDVLHEATDNSGLNSLPPHILDQSSIPNSFVSDDDYIQWRHMFSQMLQNCKSGAGYEELRANPLLAFIQSEKSKFYAHLKYMADSVKDPVFLKSIKQYKIFPTNSRSEDVTLSSLPTDQHMDVDQDDSDDTTFEKEITSILDNCEENQVAASSVANRHIPTSSTPVMTYKMATQNQLDRDAYKNLPQFRVNLLSIAVATIKLGCQYNQRKFPSVSCRSNFSQLTIGIYPHGSVASTGSTHEVASLIAFQNIVNMLRNMYGPVAFEDPYIKLNNLVLSGHVGYNICTNLLTVKFPSYFRKIKGFSGIAFVNRARIDKITLLIFRGGSICVSGGGSLESVRENTELALSMTEQCMATPANLLLESKVYGNNT